MCICCECCVLSKKCLFDELITGPEESYRLWCVVVCDLENLLNEEVLAHWESLRQNNKKGGFGVLYFTVMERGFFLEEICTEN
jgi:hypothetical protein